MAEHTFPVVKKSFDRSPVILRFCPAAVTGPVFFLCLLRTSSCNRSLSFFHFITRDLLTPLSFATAKNLPTFPLVLISSKRLRVFILKSRVYEFRLALPLRLSCCCGSSWPCPDWPLILNSWLYSD